MRKKLEALYKSAVHFRFTPLITALLGAIILRIIFASECTPLLTIIYIAGVIIGFASFDYFVMPNVSDMMHDTMKVLRDTINSQHDTIKNLNETIEMYKGMALERNNKLMDVITQKRKQ
jgi:hypothetical protein